MQGWQPGSLAIEEAVELALAMVEAVELALAGVWAAVLGLAMLEAATVAGEGKDRVEACTQVEEVLTEQATAEPLMALEKE